ncbi:MAG TPA: hypothetical protein VD927_00500 [Chryseosolibacter sp.]|nr:hypothetical protein [Chryseosolibacter sp.]
MNLLYLSLFVLNFLIWKFGTRQAERLNRKNLFVSIFGAMFFVLVIPYSLLYGVTAYARVDNQPLFNPILIFGVIIFLVPAFLKTNSQPRRAS